MSASPAFRIIEAVLATPWAMTEQYCRTIIDIASREHEITPEAMASFRSRRVDGHENMVARDGVAVIGVNGPLIRYASFFSAISGAVAYEDVALDLGRAVMDPSFRAILLNVDSPGGDVNGMTELADQIRAASAMKPVWAYVGGQCCSAAYMLASATSRIVANDMSIVGSIGVRMALRDTSERDARSGVKTIEFVSSQSPNKVLDHKTEDGRSKIQRTVDDLAAVFIGKVAAFRGMKAGDVISKFGGGGVEVGQAAVAAGMIDGLGTFEQVLSQLAKEKLPPKPAPAPLLKEPKSMTDIAKADHDAAVIKASTDAETAAQTRIAAILDSEEAKGRDGLARHFAFKTKMSAADAVAALATSPKVEPVAAPAAPAAPAGTRSSEAPGGLVEGSAGRDNIRPPAPKPGDDVVAKTHAEFKKIDVYAKFAGKV